MCGRERRERERKRPSQHGIKTVCSTTYGESVRKALSRKTGGNGENLRTFVALKTNVANRRKQVSELPNIV